jgi:hypothetical protein
VGDVSVRLGHEESENTLRGNGWYGVVCGLGNEGTHERGADFLAGMRSADIAWEEEDTKSMVVVVVSFHELMKWITGEKERSLFQAQLPLAV